MRPLHKQRLETHWTSISKTFTFNSRTRRSGCSTRKNHPHLSVCSPFVGRAGVEALLDSHAAAALLGVHPRTLQRMVLRGQITGVQVGKLWRFRASAIDHWIDQQASWLIPPKNYVFRR